MNDSNASELELLARFHDPAELDDWMAKLLFAELRGMGMLSDKGVWEASEDCLARAGVLEKHSRWWHLNCLPILQARGYVHWKHRQVQVRDEVQLSAKNQVWRDWESAKTSYLDIPALRVKVSVADDCLRNLPDILRGTAQAKDILFPNASMEKMEGLHRNNAPAAYFNSILVDFIERYVRTRIKRDPQAAIRLIEIGSRTASMVLPKLLPYTNQVREYCCTHLSKAFLTYGQEPTRGEYPFLSYKSCDIERPLLEQGIEVGAYDLAIASNVLHATANISKTIRNAKAPLKRNGLLILNEITQKSVFSSLTFGLLERWWLYEDQWTRIPGSPFLDAASWRTALEREGFGSVLLPAAMARELGQQIIVAESNGLIRQGKQATSLDSGNGKQRIRDRVESGGNTAKSVTGTVQGRKSVEDHVSATILKALSETLKISAANLDHEVPFADYGIDSILGGSFVQKISDELGITLNVAVLFDHTNVKRLTRYISESYADKIEVRANEFRETQTGNAENPKSIQPPKRIHLRKTMPFWRRAKGAATAASNASEIAIIGISGQFPGAGDVHAFWDNLIQGRDVVEEFPSHYLNQRKFFCPNRLPGKTYCKWGGVLKDRPIINTDGPISLIQLGRGDTADMGLSL